jgi:Tol biopolymer transport system component
MEVGQTLSHYRITAALGAGGMGEVYRATDTSLGRDVAIKVLPPEVAQDRDRLARFQREAHLLAALNHPNVAAIYGLEEADGKPFLALELVEGEDLQQRLARGAIPVGEALEIAEQVAEALEEAHGKGIVHRDLKPANVKVTPEGKVKVLDFGLAKAWAGGESGTGSGASALSQSPTLARGGTVAGVILGTAAYMSPEQARGKPVEKRADVWSFGVLLWEMLTGLALVSGETVTDVIAAVVTREPDLDALPKTTPPTVRRLLSRCLRKDPRTRLPDIGAARLELQDLRTGAAGTPAGAPGADAATGSRPAARGRWAAFGLAAAGLVAGVAIGGAIVSSRHRPEKRPAVHFTMDLPDGWTGVDLGWPVPSPDGRQVAFVARPESTARLETTGMLWVRPLESPAARVLAGTEGADQGQPFWSPDSQSIGFFAGGEVRKLSLATGVVQRICAMPSPGNAGADWSPQGTILFSAGGFKGYIYSVPASGGEAKALTTLDAARGEITHHVPQFLPDGRRFLFVISASRDDSAGLYVASLDAPGERRRLAPTWAHYAYADGRLLVTQGGTLLAQPFDPGRAELHGEPVAVASAVAGWTQNPALGRFGVSEAGTLAFLSGQTTTEQMQLTWLDRKGNELGTVGPPGNYGQLTLSPDQRNVGLEMRDASGKQDIWVMDVARGVATRLATSSGYMGNPVWAPDGLSLAFNTSADKGAGVHRKGLGANDTETALADSPDNDYPEDWSRDGRTLLYKRAGANGAESLWAQPLEGGGDAVPLVNNGSAVDEPQLSPDGAWFAYVSRESGRDEVYLEPFRHEGERVRVSTNGGGQPKWRRDGKELFYVTPDNHLVVVSVRAAPSRIDVGLPADLFVVPVVTGTIYDDYAPSADGQRFLVKQPVTESQKPRLHVVANWKSLLP